MAKEQLTAYSMKAKETRELLNAEISKTPKGAYMAKGVDKDGNKMCSIMNEAKALKAIADGIAKKAF